ncbi:MAG: hypothetical protein M3Z26_08150 [Bacteroidota bacterium]|nr:hypothetical protein [Bacteroidota bacterium]
MTAKNKRRFRNILVLLFAGSFFFSMIIWKWFGKNYNISFGLLEVDFFNTLFATFGMAGLVMAIYQIVELRNENEIKNATTIEVKTTKFKQESLINCERVKGGLEQLRKRILNDNFDDSVINGYINELYAFKDVWDAILIERQNLTEEPFEVCNNCLTSISELINDLFKVIDEKSFLVFKRQSVIEKISEINKNILSCENKFK